MAIRLVTLCILVLLLLEWAFPMRLAYAIYSTLLLGVSIGRIVPFMLKKKEGRLFNFTWAMRGAVACGLLIAGTQNGHFASDLERLQRFAFIFMIYVIPCEIALLVISAQAGRIVSLNEWVTATTDEVARLENAHCAFTEEAFVESKRKYRQMLMHDDEPPHIGVLLLSQSLLCICWIFADNLLPACIASVCGLLYMFPGMINMNAMISKIIPILSVLCLLALPLAKPNMTTWDLLYVVLCICTTILWIKVIISISTKRYWTVDELRSAGTTASATMAAS